MVKRERAMAEITQEIAAFTKMKDDLEKKHMGKWVIIHDGKLEGTFEAFEGAAEKAVEKFGAGPYLIRQVGAPPVRLPASVMYIPSYGSN